MKYKSIIRLECEPEDKFVIWNYHNRLLIYEGGKWKSMLGEYNGEDSDLINALRQLVNDLSDVIKQLINEDGLIRLTENK